MSRARLPQRPPPGPLFQDHASEMHFLMMGYWPAVLRATHFAKDPDRTERIFYRQGHLISEVTFFLEEQGWVMGYMLGYNDGKTGLWTTPEEAIRAHRSKALVEVPGGSPYGLLTIGQVHRYKLFAEGVQRGYEHAREWARPSCVPPAPLSYAELRDELLGFCDMPYEMGCMIALWLTRDSVSMYWLSFTVVL